MWQLVESYWSKIIQFGFRSLYNELAWTYDAVSWSVSLGRWRGWQQTVLGLSTKMFAAPVLELAHGTGDLQLDIARGDGYAVGIDISRSMGKIASSKLQRSGMPVRLVRSSAMALPFADGSFPIIVSTFPTEFIFRRETAIEIRRVLMAGGKGIVVLNGILSLPGYVVRFINWLFSVTGQRQIVSSSLLDEYRRAGLNPRLFEKSLSESTVLVMVVDKPKDYTASA